MPLDKNFLKQQKNQPRPADLLINRSFSHFEKQLIMVGNISLRYWQFYLVLIFIAGMVTAIIWAGSTDVLTQSKASGLGGCTGTHLACASYTDNQNNCQAHGCGWQYSGCTPNGGYDPSMCEGLSEGECLSMGPESGSICNPVYSCGGNPHFNSCSSITNQSSCLEINTGSSGCTWSEAPQPSFRVIAPNGGEVLYNGQTYTIRWEAQNYSNSVTIDLVDIDNPPTTHIIFSNVPAANSSAVWEVGTTGSIPIINGRRYQIRIRPSGSLTPADTSDSYFVTYVSGEANYCAGDHWSCGHYSDNSSQCQAHGCGWQYSGCTPNGGYDPSTCDGLTEGECLALGPEGGSICNPVYSCDGYRHACSLATSQASCLETANGGSNCYWGVTPPFTPGSWSVNLATSSDSLIPGGVVGATVGQLTASAIDENMAVNDFYLSVYPVNGQGINQIAKIAIYDGSTLVAEGVPTSTSSSGNTVLINPKSWIVLRGVTKNYAVKVDTRVPSSTGVAKSGGGFKVFINSGSIKAIGGTSQATVIASGGGSTSSFYVLKSVPIITSNDQLTVDQRGGGALPSSGLVAANLYSFKITAPYTTDYSGVGLERLVFLATTTNVSQIKNFGLYTAEGQRIAWSTSTAPTYLWYNDDGSKLINLFTVIDNTAEPFTIDAGTTRRFILKGDVVCTSSDCGNPTNSAQVRISLLGDSHINGGNYFTNAPFSLNSWQLSDELMDKSLVWTDYWLTGSAGYTTSTARQWWNGYLLRDSAGNYFLSTSTPAVWAR